MAESGWLTYLPASMTTPAEKALADDLDRIAARYESQFSGQPRSSRNVDELDAIIADTAALLARVESIPDAVRPASMSELAARIHTNLEIYQRERGLIDEARKIGPGFEEFAPLAAAANFVFARYHRHFAGQSRASRDLGLIQEMVDDLETIEEGMADIVGSHPSEQLQKDVDLVRRTRKMYADEAEAITEARTTGTADERASRMAGLANAQFKLYQDHFAGQPRQTRRPALLMRMVEELKRVQVEMKALQKAGGLSNDSNKKNVEIVQRQMEMYEKELGEIRKARQETPMGDLMGMLGGTANEIFEAYNKDFAGQDRKTRDLAKLRVLCDQLGEVRRQMADLSRAESSVTNEQNLDIVSSQLAAYEQEYEEIERLKGEG